MMRKCYVSFGLFLSTFVTVQSQLTVTWQGETVTGPLLIYDSEIRQTVSNNSLTCSHTTGPVAWFLPIFDAQLTTTDFGTFINEITNGGRRAQLRRGTINQLNAEFDGLWTCRLDGATGAGAFYVGIYHDTPPTTNGSITIVQCRSSPFTTNPISFQLVGDSIGGPPTTNYWTRNGVTITNNSTFSTSISFTGPFNDDGYKAANYTSTLTVTGRQPGVYQYHVSNRRTTGTRTSQVLVDGNPPTDLTLSRVGLERVRVTWTDPDIRPRGGYRIEVVSVNINMTSDMSPREITLTPRSTPYEVTLVSLSRHYPINNIMESITLNDLLAPTSPSVSSLTATSVTISWTQPVDSMTVNIYRVTLTTTSAGMCSGVNHTREENTTSTSIVIDGLEENSIYTVTISAVNNEFNAVSSTSGLTVTAGERSSSSSSSSSDKDFSSVDVSIAVVVTFFLTIILHTIVMLVACYIYRVCYANRTKSTIKRTEKENTEDTSKVDSRDFAMNECAAYGPVSSTQAQYEVMSSPQTEDTYESV